MRAIKEPLIKPVEKQTKTKNFTHSKELSSQHDDDKYLRYHERMFNVAIVDLSHWDEGGLCISRFPQSGINVALCHKDEKRVVDEYHTSSMNYKDFRTE